MSDGVIVTIRIVIKPEFADAMCGAIPAMFQDTIKFKGFRSIRAVRQTEDTNRLLIIEHWDTEADYIAYRDWRNIEGGMQAAAANLVSMDMDIWPTLVGTASL